MREEDKKELIVLHRENDRVYELTPEDMENVNKYCENECLGIQFLISANTLRQIVRIMEEMERDKPYTVRGMLDTEVVTEIERQGVKKQIVSYFGVDDFQIIFPMIIKQTYNFLFKI